MIQRTTSSAARRTDPAPQQPAEEKRASAWPKPAPERTEEKIVGLAEIEVTNGQTTFTFIGLGSCIGLFALDPVANVAGAVHVMLPRAFDPGNVEKPGKFADTGVAELLDRMVAAGADRSRIVAAYAGGACVGAIKDERPALDIGPRNEAAVKEALAKQGVAVVATDAGGTTGRTLKLSIKSGEVHVRTIQKGEAVLCTLRA